jgi:PIN domain nuclease of toxin-antitoxin system
MKYLLDTQIVYWARVVPERLSAEVRTILEIPANALWYSIVTPWELAIKEAKRKIKVPDGFYAAFDEYAAERLTINESHIATLRQLPLLHHDPFDRMLVAQAMTEKMTLITSDKRLAAYPVKVLLA